MKSTFSDSPGNHNRWFRPHFSHFCATRLGRFINESRYGGILYLALWLVVLGLVFTLFQTIFLSIAYTGPGSRRMITKSFMWSRPNMTRVSVPTIPVSSDVFPITW